MHETSRATGHFARRQSLCKKRFAKRHARRGPSAFRRCRERYRGRVERHVGNVADRLFHLVYGLLPRAVVHHGLQCGVDLFGQRGLAGFDRDRVRTFAERFAYDLEISASPVGCEARRYGVICRDGRPPAPIINAGFRLPDTCRVRSRSHLPQDFARCRRVFLLWPRIPSFRQDHRFR